MDGSRFEGQWLSEYLEDYHGITRRAGESDWELRKRAYVEVFDQDPVAAVEFLFGCRYDDLSPRDLLLIGVAISYRGNKERCTSFVEQFGGDPMLSRNKTI